MPMLVVVVAVMFVVLVVKVPLMPLVVHVLRRRWCGRCGGCLSERDGRKAREQCSDEQRLGGGHGGGPGFSKIRVGSESIERSRTFAGLVFTTSAATAR
jgi:hypothetical protein